MIKMAYPEIIAKIKEEKTITDSELEDRVKKKMDMLSGLISKEGAAYIVANELGVKLVQTTGQLQIKNILVGMRSVETAGRVMRKFPINEFERNGRPGKVGSFMIADETGQIRMTAWHDMTDLLSKFEEGDIIKITGGYVRENNGFKEIHLNSSSKLEVNPEGITINVQATPSNGETGAAMPKAERKKIADLTKDDNNVEIFGHVVQIFDPRFWAACPQCNKKTEQVEGGFRCAEHGPVEPKHSYVLNAFVDDGSDNMRVVFFSRQALSLLSLKDEDMQVYRAEPEKFESIKTELLGELVKIIGAVNKNDMFDRLEMRARLVFRDVKPENEITKLKEQGAETQEKEPEPAKTSPTTLEEEEETGPVVSPQEEKPAQEKKEEAETEIKEAETDTDKIDEVAEEKTYKNTDGNKEESTDKSSEEKKEKLPTIDDL